MQLNNDDDIVKAKVYVDTTARTARRTACWETRVRPSEAM